MNNYHYPSELLEEIYQRNQELRDRPAISKDDLINLKIEMQPDADGMPTQFPVELRKAAGCYDFGDLENNIIKTDLYRIFQGFLGKNENNIDKTDFYKL